jgi:AcrR family transcriptional regulator
VLDRSVQLASLHGLEGLSIGALAADLGIHKSSVHALFGSKEVLQLQTVEAARLLLVDQVIMPVLSCDLGLTRLRALGDTWCDYLGGDTFAGGCFLCAASAEMDGREGPVRDAVEAAMRQWIAALTGLVQATLDRGELRADVDPSAMAFRLNALGMAANWQRQLFGETSGIEYARRGWRSELDSAAESRD